MDDRISQATPAYTSAEKKSVLISTLLGYILDFYNILIISFLMTSIQKALGISLTQSGVITSVTLAASVVGGVVFGWLGDRMGRRTSLLLTLGVFSLGAILSAFSWDFTSLLIFRAIAGIGLGGEWGAGMVLFNEVWDKNRRGFGSAFIQAATAVGLAAASVVAIWSMSTFGEEWGWRVALLTGGSPILLMIYVRFWMPESRLWIEYMRMRVAGELPADKQASKVSLIEIFRGVSLRYTLLGMVLAAGYLFAYYSLAVFMPGLMKGAGAPQETIRTATLVVALSSAFSFLVFGWYSDRLGRKTTVVVPAVINLIAFVGIYWVVDDKYAGVFFTWPLFIWYVIWVLGMAGSGMFGCWFSELYPVELRSTAVSTIYMVGRGAGSLAPYIVPAIAVAWDTPLINGIMLGFLAMLLSLVAGLLLPETAGRTFAVIESKSRTASERSLS